MAKYYNLPVHLCMVTSRAEAIWVARMTFMSAQWQQQQEDMPQALPQQQQQQQQLQAPPTQPALGSSSAAAPLCRYETLQSVEVSPSFPEGKSVVPFGIICREDCDTVVEQLQQVAGSTLGDMLDHSAANTRTAPPMGFQIMTAYCDTVSTLHGAPNVRPCAHYATSLGGAATPEPVDLSGATVVFLGPKSAVLRVPGAESAIKVAKLDSINHELRVHKVVDSEAEANCLRPLDALAHGVVEGAGEGLGFLGLKGWGELVPATGLCRDPRLCTRCFV